MRGSVLNRGTHSSVKNLADNLSGGGDLPGGRPVLGEVLSHVLGIRFSWTKPGGFVRVCEWQSLEIPGCGKSDR